jgi:hypothetical protein
MARRHSLSGVPVVIAEGQLDLEQHGGHTPEGVTVRVLQRILAPTPPSGTTTEPASPSSARSWLMTTDPLESII